MQKLFTVIRAGALAGLFGAAALFAQNPTTLFPVVRGTHYMIGAGNNLEVAAGMRILERGGNAVDAGVASVLAASVTELDHFGLGGEMPLLIKMKDKPVVVVSGVGTAPALATPEFFHSRKPEPWESQATMPPIPENGILAATVPGVFDGLMLALEKYGTMSFAQVAGPALEYTGGFPATEILSNYILANQQYLNLWPVSLKFFEPDGHVPRQGEIFAEPAMRHTLEELAAVEKKAHGKRAAKIEAVRNYFYRGPIAKQIDAFSQKNGGLLRYADMAGYRAETDTPRTTDYRGYTIEKPGFWTQGPVMLEALNILEGYDLKAMGHNSPQYLHTVVEAVKLAFADRDRYYGDPKFSKIPEETLLSKEYAAERRKLIDAEHASMESRPGAFGGPMPMPHSTTPTSGVADTTSVDAVDPMGNVFSATPSGAWLPSVIAGDTGIPLGTRLQSLLVDSPGHANQLAAGKRPRVTLSPTMVLKDGKPFLALSTPGGDNQDQALLQVLLNIIDFGMTPQRAVEAPRFQTEHFYASFANHEFGAGKLNLENRIPKDTADALAKLGHKVNVAGPWSNGSAPVVIEMAEGVLHGAADPRRGRYIFGR
ncbi:MAG: gamma-glutamyltransferase family protein [Acidobacteriota bacterium]|nr:gamma-glutamyltransferase family protein [Acidobacteriota bacterium]